MAEPRNYTFGHREVAEILIKQLNLNEGLWGVYIEFGLGAGNIPTSPDAQTLTPAVINFINKIGIQRLDAPSNLTVDAAQVNPAHGRISRKKSSHKRP